MPIERRKAYRAIPTSDDGIWAEIRGAKEQAAGDVLDLSLTGATILFASSQNPTFAVGELVTAYFDSESKDSVEVQAKIQSRSERDDSRRFGLVFLDPSGLRATLPPRLFRLFNQRETFRVQPSEATPVEIRMRAQGSEVVGLLKDISADGIGLLIDTQVEARFSSVMAINLTFQLPGDDCNLSFNAFIRNRFIAEDEGKVCYGLQLDPTDSSNFTAQQKHIVRFVMRRQRELIHAPIKQ